MNLSLVMGVLLSPLIALSARNVSKSKPLGDGGGAPVAQPSPGAESNPTTDARPTPTAKAICKFPTFPRASEWLKTKNSGKCNGALAAEYGGDCENFHWLGLRG